MNQSSPFKQLVVGCKLALKLPTSAPTAVSIDGHSIFGKNPEAVLKVSAIFFSRNSQRTASVKSTRSESFKKWVVPTRCGRRQMEVGEAIIRHFFVALVENVGLRQVSWMLESTFPYKLEKKNHWGGGRKRRSGSKSPYRLKSQCQKSDGADFTCVSSIMQSFSGYWSNKPPVTSRISDKEESFLNFLIIFQTSLCF